MAFLILLCFCGYDGSGVHYDICPPLIHEVDPAWTVTCPFNHHDLKFVPSKRGTYLVQEGSSLGLIRETKGETIIMGLVRTCSGALVIL